MKTHIGAYLLLTMAAAILASPALGATPFEDEFELVHFEGTCQVKQPVRKLEAAVKGSKYAYGTVVKTGRNSYAFVRFSMDNGFKVFARTSVTVTEDMKNKKYKILKLDDTGKVQVMLQEDFHETNQLRVETPSAVCGAVGCNFVVDYAVVDALRTTKIICKEGEVGASAGEFECFVTKISAGDMLTISEAPDGKYLRIKIVSGNTVAVITNADGVPQEIGLEEGDVIRIFSEELVNEPEKVVVAYEIDYGRPSKQDKLIITVEEKKDSGDREPLPPGTAWPSVVITEPNPEVPNVTPVGKR